MSPLMISWLLAAAPAVGQADSLKFPLGLAIGPDQALYISEREGHRVVRIDPASGGMLVVAGTGVPGFGDLVFDEWAGHMLLRLDQREQRIRVLAGTLDSTVVDAEGSDPLKTRFGLLGGMVRDSQGRYYVVEPEPGRVTCIDLEKRRVETVFGPKRDRD